MLEGVQSKLIKIKEIALFLVLYPVMVLCIAADRYLLRYGNPLCPYPRTAEEVTNTPKRLLDLLKLGGRAGVPADASVVSFRPDVVGLESEPDKNETIIMGDLTYSASGVQKTIGVFVKLPTGRPQTVWAKAINPTISRTQREVAFYNNVVSHFTDTLRVPFPAAVPECYFAGWSRCFDRAIIVSRKIDTRRDYVSIPDWQGVSVAQLKAQLRQAANVHAATWGGYGKGLEFIKDREGHKWLDGIVRIFWNKLPAIEKIHWDAILRRCKNAHVCFSHLDCRAGNMLFKGDGDEKEVFMTDWEACGILPVMWDVAYAMVCSLPTPVRRAHQDEIVDSYLEHLEEQLKLRVSSGFYAGYRGKQPLELPSRSECRDMIIVSYFVINFFGFVLVCIGNVGKTQGNTTTDVDTWSSRLKAAQREVLDDPARPYRDILQLSDEHYEELRAYLASL